MPYLEILLPTGHKDKIEVNNNTLLISVLEEVCNKRNLDIDCCYLVHNKIKVDLSAKFGISKLINNSKLELIISPVSLIDNIQLEIALQLPNSQRIANRFSPQESVWAVLLKCIETNPENKSVIFEENTHLTPVVFHLHHQIVGEYCLQNTSLASLGFRSGKSLLRFELKDVPNEEIQSSIETLNKNLKRHSSTEENQKTNETVKVEMSTESVYIQDHISSEFRHVDQIVSQHNEQFSLDEFSPFSMFPSNRSLFGDPHHETQKKAQNKRSATLGELLGLNFDHEDNGSIQQQEFIDFKFPEETAGKNLMECEEKPKENFSFSHENRQSVFYYRKPVEKLVSEEIPDSFFEITENDLRQIITSYRQAAETDAPLLTKALKEQMREAQFSKYQCCVIQFHFQDAYILQSVFKPKETIGDLYEFVKYYLRNDSGNFNLYTTPPKEILKDKDLTLIKGGLVPMSKIYVSVRAKEFCLGNFDMITSIDDEDKARELVKKWMALEKSESDSVYPSQRGLNACGSSEIDVKKPNISRSNKIPKWFNK